jgi:hypothetical protein
MVVDTKEVAIATAYGKSAIEGEYSHNRGFVILMDYIRFVIPTEDNIKHGDYSMKSLSRWTVK